MNNVYHIDDTSEIITPALVVFRDIVETNLQTMVEIAGDVARLRPHCKTHKMPAVTRMELDRGITKHKCATIAEAEMLADAGVPDILLAYNIVGANIARVAEFTRRFPDVNFMVTADHPAPVESLSRALSTAGLSVGVLLDLDTGMHRTGIGPGQAAVELYRQIAGSPGLEAAGIHAYDGHHHEHDPGERAAAIEEDWQGVIELRDQLLAADLPVPRIVASGTPGFPIHAARNDPLVELSPGTTVFHDAGSVANYPDLPFTPAALVLTRVISRPGEDLVTFDVGSKGIASDPPVAVRVSFPDLTDAEVVKQNEEHLIVRTNRASEFAPGDEQLVIPWHVCPTSAMHKQAYVISGGKLVDHWDVTARDRQLTI
jgi:D-serine deaminase-like pyridoxal phosphate-dependent protein